MLRPHPAFLIPASLAVIAASLAAQSPAPQDTDAPGATLKLNVRTVLVDVVVTDNNHHAVPGLTKEDFKVFEDGKQQTLTFFEPNFAPDPDAATAPETPLPPNTFTNVPAVAPNDAINLLLMDALNTAEGDQSYVHKEMVRYLASLPPRVRIGIFLLSERLRIIQGFTQDSTALRAAIARLAANPNPSALLPTIESTNAQQNIVNIVTQTAAAQGQGGIPDAYLTQTAEALQQFIDQQNSFEQNERLRMTLESFQQIARYLAGVPGRKNLVWFVGSFPHCLSAILDATSSVNASLANGGCPYNEMSRKTVDMLADARVSIYPVQATGLTIGTMFNAENPMLPGAPVNFQGMIQGQRTSLNSDFQENSLTMTDMDTIAASTGGVAHYNGNDLKGALAADIDNGSRYYTIAYVPTNNREIGKERRIEIKTAGNYKLSYRRGYFEDTPKQLAAAEAAPTTDPLRPLMDRGMPDFTQLSYRMSIKPAAAQPPPDAPHAGDNAALKGPFTRYTVGFQLAPTGLDLKPDPNGVQHGQIEIALVAYSQDGKPLNWLARAIGVSIRPEQAAIARSAGIPVHFDIDAPPGDVYLRTGIYDLSSNHAGTLEVPLSSVTIAAK